MRHENKNNWFIVFLDDDGEKTPAFVELVETNPAYVLIKTYRQNEFNLVMLPWHRVLKLKKRIEGVEDET